MTKDITGIGVPISSRDRRSSPKGGKKDSPKIAPLLIALIGGQMQKDSEKSAEYGKYVPGKYGGKQTGSQSMGSDGMLSLGSLKENSPMGISAGFTTGSTQWSGSEQNETDAINMKKRLKTSASLDLDNLKTKRRGIQLKKGKITL